MAVRNGVISICTDRALLPGTDVDEAINEQIDKATIILLLVSQNYLVSEYCYNKEMARALRRNAEGKARVIPVILTPCDWKHTPLAGLLAAPKDGTPVTDWKDQNKAFLDITDAIRRAAEKFPVGKPPEYGTEYFFGQPMDVVDQKGNEPKTATIPKPGPEVPVPDKPKPETPVETEPAAVLFNLGMKHELGIGVLPDPASARRYYIRAARKGHSQAMYNLGLLYEQGEGVIAPNEQKARVWFRLAGRANSQEGGR
jgi:TPR repeat protein